MDLQAQSPAICLRVSAALNRPRSRRRLRYLAALIGSLLAQVALFTLISVVKSIDWPAGDAAAQAIESVVQNPQESRHD